MSTFPWQFTPDDLWKPEKDREDDPNHYYDVCIVGARYLYRRRSPERIAQIEAERALWKLTAQKYNRQRPCVKCGNTKVSTAYHRDAELMIRTCHCGYEWRELPLDAEGATP